MDADGLLGCCRSYSYLSIAWFDGVEQDTYMKGRGTQKQKKKTKTKHRFFG
jgi:hypothetical protein